MVWEVVVVVVMMMMVLLLLLLGRPFLVLTASTKALEERAEHVPEEAHRGGWGASVDLWN